MKSLIDLKNNKYNRSKYLIFISILNLQTTINYCHRVYLDNYYSNTGLTKFPIYLKT